MPNDNTPVVGADGNPAASTTSPEPTPPETKKVDVDNDTPDGLTASTAEGTDSTDTPDSLVGKVADVAPFTPPETVQVKVDGKIVDVPWDDLMKGYSHGNVAALKMTEANQKHQQATQFLQMLKTNPVQVLTDPSLGVDFRAIAEEYLAEQIQYEGMSEEQRDLVDTKAKLKDFERMQAEAKSTQEAKELAALQTQVTNDINSAIESTNLPNNEFIFQRVAYYMNAMLDQNPGMQQVNPVDVIDLVREDYQKEIQTLFGGSDAETLISLLGEDAIGKVRKFDSNRLKTKEDIVPETKQGKKVKTKEKKKKMTPTEFRRKLGI